VFNPGAIELESKVWLVRRLEGSDRKSFFTIAESEGGVDNFRFWDYPVEMPETDDPDTPSGDLMYPEFIGCSRWSNPRDIIKFFEIQRVFDNNLIMQFAAAIMKLTLMQV